MNRLGATTWPIAIGLALAGPAFAQSSVALYGIVDQSVRYTTHASAANDSAVRMANGAITNSRWGMKGAEDLGDGLKAIFRLENGFEPQSGQADGARLFGRYAYVGLSGRLGTVELGRQTTEGFNLFGDLDPLTIGNYTANMWPYFLTQGYANNVVSYANTLGGLAVGASYGLGGVAGAMSRNAYWGVRSAYTHGALTVGAVYQQTRDADGRAQQMWGAAGRYAVGPATLFAGYLGGKDATGAIDRDYLNAPRPHRRVRLVRRSSALRRDRLRGRRIPCRPGAHADGRVLLRCDPQRERRRRQRRQAPRGRARSGVCAVEGHAAVCERRL